MGEVVRGRQGDEVIIAVSPPHPLIPFVAF